MYKSMNLDNLIFPTYKAELDSKDGVAFLSFSLLLSGVPSRYK